MTERIAIFSLYFDSHPGKTDTVYVRLPIQVGTYVNVSDACEALAEKLGQTSSTQKTSPKKISINRLTTVDF